MIFDRVYNSLAHRVYSNKVDRLHCSQADWLYSSQADLPCNKTDRLYNRQAGMPCNNQEVNRCSSQVSAAGRINAADKINGTKTGKLEIANVLRTTKSEIDSTNDIDPQMKKMVELRRDC